MNHELARPCPAELLAPPARPRPPKRHIALPGTYNFRDAGRYPAGPERQTRWGTLYRSDSLHALSPDAQRELLDLGVTTILDLRRQDEAALAPNVFQCSGAVRYHHVPVSSAGLLDLGSSSLATVYRGMLEREGDAFRRVFSILGQPAAWPAIVHCTAGKDRTGLVVALLLSVAGVPREVIVGDYALTSRYLRGPDFEAARLQAAEHGFAWATTPELLACPPEAMEQVLTWLDDGFDGVEGYLAQIGVDRPTVRVVRSALVEPRRVTSSRAK
jgi:protein-tyrosine phosphatase